MLKYCIESLAFGAAPLLWKSKLSTLSTLAFKVSALSLSDLVDHVLRLSFSVSSCSTTVSKAAFLAAFATLAFFSAAFFGAVDSSFSSAFFAFSTIFFSFSSAFFLSPAAFFSASISSFSFGGFGASASFLTPSAGFSPSAGFASTLASAGAAASAGLVPSAGLAASASAGAAAAAGSSLIYARDPTLV